MSNIFSLLYGASTAIGIERACCCATTRLPAIPESQHLCCVTELIKKKKNKMG